MQEPRGDCVFIWQNESEDQESNVTNRRRFHGRVFVCGVMRTLVPHNPNLGRPETLKSLIGPLGVPNNRRYALAKRS